METSVTIVHVTPTRPDSTKQMVQEHETCAKLQQDLHSWTSNTVLVVDTSGTMRTADILVARTRLSAVWLSIALDFIAQRIESDTAGNTDVISIITLGSDPKCVFQDEPTTWVFYNKIATVHNTASIMTYPSSLRLARGTCSYGIPVHHALLVLCSFLMESLPLKCFKQTRQQTSKTY